MNDVGPIIDSLERRKDVLFTQTQPEGADHILIMIQPNVTALRFDRNPPRSSTAFLALQASKHINQFPPPSRSGIDMEVKRISLFVRAMFDLNFDTYEEDGKMRMIFYKSLPPELLTDELVLLRVRLDAILKEVYGPMWRTY